VPPVLAAPAGGTRRFPTRQLALLLAIAALAAIGAGVFAMLRDQASQPPASTWRELARQANALPSRPRRRSIRFR
jgi:hypothetical protein